jgi:hypothetical protein
LRRRALPGVAGAAAATKLRPRDRRREKNRRDEEGASKGGFDLVPTGDLAGQNVVHSFDGA